MTPADRLLQRFVPNMERQGYIYRKTNHRFLKAFAHGKYEFSLTFDGRGGFTAVDAAFFVNFEALLKQFKKILGHSCPWTAGATLLNAGADPWKLWLCEDRYVSMSPSDRAGIPSEVIHPDSKIDAGLEFLANAHARYALPFFQQLKTYRDLANFYGVYLENGCTSRCRPMAENVVYLSLILAAGLGDDMRRIAGYAAEMQSVYAGRDVSETVARILEYLRSHNLAGLFVRA